MDAAKSDFFALLASSDTDVFSKRRELTKNKRLDLEVFIVKGCAKPPVERYCDLVQIRCTNSESGNAVLSDHQFDKDDCETVGILADVCALIVLKCLYIARFRRPQLQWIVIALA